MPSPRPPRTGGDDAGRRRPHRGRARRPAATAFFPSGAWSRARTRLFETIVSPGSTITWEICSPSPFRPHEDLVPGHQHAGHLQRIGEARAVAWYDCYRHVRRRARLRGRHRRRPRPAASRTAAGSPPIKPAGMASSRGAPGGRVCNRFTCTVMIHFCALRGRIRSATRSRPGSRANSPLHRRRSAG